MMFIRLLKNPIYMLRIQMKQNNIYLKTLTNLFLRKDQRALLEY